MGYYDKTEIGRVKKLDNKKRIEKFDFVALLQDHLKAMIPYFFMLVLLFVFYPLHYFAPDLKYIVLCFLPIPILAILAFSISYLYEVFKIVKKQ